MVYNGYILLIKVYRHCNHKLLVSARCGRSAAIKMGDIMPVEVMMWNYCGRSATRSKFTW